MKRRVVAAGFLAGALAMAGFAGSVSASNAVSTYDFYNCTGPGVPSSFSAVKTALPGAASHPVSSASAFRVLDSTDVYTVYDFGFGAPHGITVSGVAVDWCYVDFQGFPGTLVGGQYQSGG
jgi:hypothetical protein